jgi:hypothetical protein
MKIKNIMLMKRFPIFLSLFLFSSFLFSQNTPEKWVHGYLDFGYEDRYLPDQTSGDGTWKNEHYEWGFRNLSPGLYKLNEKGVYSEWSLTSLRFEVEDDVNTRIYPIVTEPTHGERTITASLGIRYEAGVTPRKWLAGFFRPCIGFGAAPELRYFDYTPKISQRYPFQRGAVFVGLNLIPRLHFRLSERLALMAVVPVQFGSAEWSIEHVESPVLTKDQRTTNLLSLDLGLSFTQARLGLALKI